MTDIVSQALPGRLFSTFFRLRVWNPRRHVIHYVKVWPGGTEIICTLVYPQGTREKNGF